MRSPIIDMLRAYLLTASVAAILIEVPVLLALDLFRISEKVFASMSFRAGVAIAIVMLVLATKRLASIAFRSALAHHYATISSARPETISVSSSCPARMLVILHLRFNRALINLG
jgi:hypothetical protein